MIYDQMLKTDINDLCRIYATSNNRYNVVDHLIVCSLVYKQLLSSYASSVYTKGNAEVEITGKCQMLYDFIQEKKSAVYTYYELSEYILGLKKANFFGLTGDEISKIIMLYNRTTVVVDFSSNYFDIKMYRLPAKDINFTVIKNMQKIHNSVMSPIAHYYSTFNNAAEKGILVFGCREFDYQQIGKCIFFTHAQIPNSIILSDINSRKIRIPVEYVKEVDGRVKLVTKL